jgi:hypothetical protein
VNLVLLFASFLAAALARQRFLHSFLFARLEVKGVTLHFLDDVLLLDLSLETPQGVLQRFTFLNANFRQTANTPRLVRKDIVVIPVLQREVKQRLSCQGPT